MKGQDAKLQCHGVRKPDKINSNFQTTDNFNWIENSAFCLLFISSIAQFAIITTHQLAAFKMLCAENVDLRMISS